uniref:MFS transporter n=1 Tax=Thermosphaera aggregans TaxID=54254 RepID=A0A7C2FXA3_9CREN
MKRAVLVFILLGFVSLFADITYEGAASVRGSYLYLIGATALIAGFLRIGEIINYLTRFLSGLIGDYFRSSRILWILVVTGYAINVVSIPLLAFAKRWELVLMLVILERIGKGLRAPARDVILSEITESVGKGLGFGIHEFLDQIGAFTGPLLASLILLNTGGNYGLVFIALGVPGLIAVGLVLTSMMLHPSLKSFSATRKRQGFRGLGKPFYIYVAGLMLMSLGFLSWDIFTFTVKSSNTVSDEIIPLFYTLAMLVDGLAAIPVGVLYDKIGLASILAAPFTLVASAFFLQPSIESLFIFAGIWGFAMGVFETNVRVAVSDLVTPSERSLGYGVFGLFYGLSLMVGGIAQGFTYTLGKEYLKSLVIVSETLSAILMVYLIITSRRIPSS